MLDTWCMALLLIMPDGMFRMVAVGLLTITFLCNITVKSLIPPITVISYQAPVTNQPGLK